MNIAVVLYERLNSIRPLPFSLSDLLLVVYLHDVEKLRLLTRAIKTAQSLDDIKQLLRVTSAPD